MMFRMSGGGERCNNLMLSWVFLTAMFCVYLQEKSTRGAAAARDSTIMCRGSERQALLDFKQSLQFMNNPEVASSSSSSSSWEGKDCCAWKGVVCNNVTGYVEQLDIHAQSWVVATGNISHSLLKLQHLSLLDLSGNDFNGIPIPDFFGSLENLRRLHLSSANFSGTIPPQLGNLSHLEALYVGSDPKFPNKLSVSNLEWLFHLTSLEELDLSFSDLSKVTDWSRAISELPSLEKLNMNDCNLPSSIPSSSPSLVNSNTHLTHLSLSGNDLASSAIYPWLFNVSSNLVSLDLSRNQLKGVIPESFGTMVNITYLDLGYNLLNATISENIGELTRLVFLRLAGNSFENVVVSEAHFSNLASLQKLDLSYSSLVLKFNSGWIPPFQLDTLRACSCNLGPRFPEWLQTQTKIVVLDISNAKILDSLPIWFWDSFNQVQHMNLSFNQINGTLPMAPTQKPLLQSLSLSNNMFSGPISSVTNFIFSGFLGLLDLSNNQYSGEIPADCFKKFRLLRVLNLADNNLSGSIPISVGLLDSLEMLSLRGNRFSGEVPSSLQNCMNLKFLDLSGNKLSGRFSLWMNQTFSSLIFLSIQNNQINGDIPYQLCRSKYIQILDLSVNNISGTIPQCFRNFTTMTQKWNPDQKTIAQPLQLVNAVYPGGGTSYTDNIVLNYVAQALLVWKGAKQMYAQILGLLLLIDLSSNKLTGDIPEEITSLGGLVALNLSRNLLTGKIPQTIGQLRELNSLDLSRNNISGSIPLSLSEITFLGSLDLSYNYLSGRIPTGTQMQRFDPYVFSHNQELCGPPVSPTCSPSSPPQGQPEIEEGDSNEFLKPFYLGIGLGFAMGFWGFCGTLLLKRSWRNSYFRFLDKMRDWVYVTYALQKARLMRKIKC